jgi:superfamily II DNA/RNA helicase
MNRRRDEKVEVKYPSKPSTTQVDTEEIKEESLTRLKQTHVSTIQVPQDGEFSSYPEITAKTAEKLKARGIVNLFPIQQHCFYPIYNREDLIARDLTGSGKTLAFCLPFVEYLRKNRLLGQRRIQAIVLAPTRELALQVKIYLLKNYSIGIE